MMLQGSRIGRTSCWRAAAAATALFLNACVNSAEIVSQLVQFTPNSGRFISDPNLAIELRKLDQPSYQKFKVFYQGDRRQPEIIVLDVADDRYSFDARNWKRIEGGAAMTLVRSNLDSGRAVEAVVGIDIQGRVLSFGIVVKELDGPVPVPGKFRYIVRYQRFGRYEITQVQSPKQKPRTQSIIEGQ
jgi:hypothetical protein